MASSNSQEAILCLSLMLRLFQLSEGTLKFTLEPPDPSYARSGSNAKLVWDYSVDNQADLDGIIYSVQVSGGTFTNMLGLQSDGTVLNFPSNIPNKYKGRVRIEGRASLVIENITSQDNATFKCTLVAKPGAGQDGNSRVQLIVTVAPQISISSVPSSYNEGSVVSIICTASGIPEPDVKWFRNEIMKSQGTRRAFLTFNNVSRTDDGRYKCQANNSAGDSESYVALVVHYKPEGTTLTTTAADNTVTQGDTVTFTCRVMGAKPQVSRYIFYLNDTTIVKDGNDIQYNISSVQRSQHYGKYKCVPSNNVGGGPEATVTLNVNVPMQFTVLPKNRTVNETNSILLSCDASGFPEPSFTWTKNGKVLSKSKQLNIERSYRNNTGTYECTASNGVGRDKTAKSFVTVQYPATIKTVSASSDKSWIGQAVTLMCKSDGFPSPTLTWYKPDGSQINSDTAKESRVDVKMSFDQDFGVYKCVAANGLTPADQKTVEIKQIKAPDTPTIESSLVIQATSLTVKWTAPADDGGSPITAYRVVMLKGGTEIKNVNITDSDTTSLPVGDLKRDTEYTVKVFARNAVFEGPAGEKQVRTKYEGVPSAATIDDLPSEVTDDTITLKWSEPQDNGRVITQYTVYQRIVTDDKPGDWIKLKKITNVSVRELTVELESGKVYEFVVTATNELGESVKENGKIMRVKASNEGGGDGEGKKTDDVGNGMGTAIYAGAAAAGVLLIIGIIVIIVLWRRRKPSRDEDTSRDELGSANHYESEDGYHSVSREAAQSLQPSGPAAEPNYALVDQSRKKKNRMPANDQYAQVDKSIKTKKKKKKPGELDYADLEDLRADIQLGPVPSGGAAAAAPIVRPPAYEGTEYADISQFGVPQPDPTYSNVPKQEVVYSNVESM